jgi:hypothetical protein
MAIERHTLHLDTQDLKTLTKLARQETKATGVYISAAGMIRRMIKEYLKTRAEEKRSR